VANTNPYSIDVENQLIKGNGIKWSVEDLNNKLPEDVEFERFKDDCDCEKIGEWVEATPDMPQGYRKPPEYDPTLIHRGDKWGLKICKKCGGVWAWHDARADYY